MEKFFLLYQSSRVKQWIKNIFIFAPVVFGLKELIATQSFHWELIKNSITAFFLFSLLASGLYIINDCFDKNQDQLHPAKKNRPIASGRLPVAWALTFAISLQTICFVLIYLFNRKFFYIALFYIVLNLLYSLYLKKIVILDVMIIGIGFVVRVEIGGVINQIDLSSWILVITFLGAIFLGLIKRRQEMFKLGSENDHGETRSTLKEYNLSLLDQLISITTATTLISYIIYVLNPGIQEKFQTRGLVFTVPFVIFGIFRYLYLTYSKGMGESPDEIIFSDIPFSLNILLWGISFVFLIIL